MTRYDDVTSVFTDDANYETRPKGWWLGLDGDRAGRDLWGEVPVLAALERRVDAAVEGVVERILADARNGGDSAGSTGSTTSVSGSERTFDGSFDLATGFAARLPIELWGAVLGIGADSLERFASAFWRMQRGVSWDPVARVDGVVAFDELVALVEEFMALRRADPGDDLISAATQLEPDDGIAITACDIVTTLLEADHETLHGGLANMWFQLLTNPDQLDVVRRDPRLVPFAWLETLRHSPPVHSAYRFCLHEVERFGRLLPDGAMLHLSATAANRDPRVFTDPELFLVDRRDLCQREPRGQYRADGLPSGIAFGLGPPSPYPAVPKERPRSMYAITRDLAVTASRMLLDAFASVRLADGAEPTLHSLRLGEMYTCWALRVTLSPYSCRGPGPAAVVYGVCVCQMTWPCAMT